MGSENGGTTLDQAARNAPSGLRHSLPLPVLTLLAHPDLSRIGDRAVLGELARWRCLPAARPGCTQVIARLLVARLARYDWPGNGSRPEEALALYREAVEILRIVLRRDPQVGQAGPQRSLPVGQRRGGRRIE